MLKKFLQYLEERIIKCIDSCGFKKKNKNLDSIEKRLKMKENSFCLCIIYIMANSI